MRRPLACLIGCLLAVVSSYAQSEQSQGQQVDKIFAFAGPDSPGCALAVIRDGQIVLKRGYGLADLDHEIAISPTTVFHVASVSKQFTAMSIQLLVQQGKISLDDDVRKYIPELNGVPARITIRHLLHHTSGLRDQWSLLIMSGWRLSEDVVREEDVLELVSKMRHLNFQPGDHYAYSNTGYTLLGIIVKRVSGKSLREFADANIFKPLDMNHTFFRDDHTVTVKNQAYAYNRKQSGAYGLSVPNYDTVGASSLLTTVEDLAKWDKNFSDLRVGGPAVHDAMHVTGVLNSGDRIEYASGLVLGRYKGLKIVEHSGGDAGYRSHLIRFPDQRFTVACLCNLGNTAPGQFARQVADIFLADSFAEKAPASRAPVIAELTLSEEQLHSKIGAYWSATTEDLGRVSIRDGKLHLAVPGNSSLLQAVSESRFLLANGAGEVEFSSTATRKRHFSVRFGDRRPVIFAALAPPDTSVARLSEYSGDYFSNEIETTYRVERRNDKLIVLRRKFLPINLEAVFRDGFTSPGFGTVRFTRSTSGQITGMILSSGRIRDFRFQRVRSAMNGLASGVRAKGGRIPVSRVGEK